MPDPKIRRLLFALFFFSGACGLIYEIVWTRMMTLVFGVSVYAVSTVLCSFMAGLALGSFWFGRAADRAKKILIFYGALEIGVALFALAFPFILKGIEPLFVSLYRHFYVNYYLFSVLRFAIIFVVLLVPTFFMGGTFPVASRYFVRGRDFFSRDVGFLYAVNTTGAALGAFAVGFVMLGEFGISKTTLITAGINLSIGILAMLAGRGERLEIVRQSKEIEPPPTNTTYALPILAIGFSGFASLALEVLWSRVLTFHTHNSTYAFSAMLTTFLVGLAAGSWGFGVLAPRISKPILFFALIEWAIGLWSVFSLYLLGKLPRLVEALSAKIAWNDWREAILLIMAQTAVILIVPTFLMGMTLPLATRLVTRNLEKMGRSIGGVYGANTLGTVLGSFVAGFVLIPFFGVRNSFLIVATLNALIAVALFLGSKESPPLIRFGAPVACLAFALAGPRVVPLDVISRDFSRAMGTLVFYKEEVTDTIMVIDQKGDKNWRTLVFSDGRGTAGHWTRQEDRFYGHVPMLLHENPKNVLVICVGAGNTIGAITRHKRLERLDCVELSAGVPEAAKMFETNEGVFNPPVDPRIHLHIEDGRNFLLGTDQKFDIIHLDPPELFTAGVVFLYTEEFYNLCKARLNPGGIMSHWFNAAKMTEAEQRVVVATFFKVFPHGTVWQGPGLYSWNLIASDSALEIPLKKISDRLRDEPKVVASLAEDKMDDPLRLFSHLLMNEKTVAEYSRGASIITDDSTIIDFTDPKAPYSGFGFVSMFTPGKDLYEHFVSSQPSAKRPPPGGWATMAALAQSTDDPAASINWNGIAPDEKSKDLEILRSRVQERKDAMKKFLLPPQAESR